MEAKFDIIKPNLYTLGDDVYFGIDPCDVISVSRSIDEIVKNHIGELKVRKSNLEVLRFGKSKEELKKYDAPLSAYLDALDKSGWLVCGEELTNDYAKLFELGYVIDAETEEQGSDVTRWIRLRKDLAEPEKTFDEWDRQFLELRVDRQKTLELMKKVYEEIGQRVPDNYAELFVIDGRAPFSGRKNLGRINLTQVKSQDRVKIEEAKSQLIERLKQVDGPCLSLDAASIMSQIGRLYNDAAELVQKYGDALPHSNWRERLFKRDP